MSLSAIIMELEVIARGNESGLMLPEETAQRLETTAEQLFRLAGSIRHGRGGV